MPKVTLNTPHTHNGTAYAAGADIEVDQADATWLAEQHVIDPLPVVADKSNKAPLNNNEVK